MPVPFLDLKSQHAALAADIDAAITAVRETQQFILGPAVERFEEAMAARLGVRHAVGVASGTDALLLSVKALQAGAGAEVVVPSFTFFATAGAVWNAGLKPVFAEVDGDTFNVTAESIERAVTKRTVAIVPVHLYGQMAPMAPIMEVARSRDLVVIEDVAQAQGARQLAGGAMSEAGSVGDVGAFSFFPTKILGAFGDAGMIASRDDAIGDRVRKLRVHGGHKMYHHEEVGTNSRLDALQAAILSAKLPHVAGWVHARREVASWYDAALADVPQVSAPAVMDGNEHVYNVYTIRAERRDELRTYLTEQGIGTNVYYPLPLHLQPCFGELGGRAGDLPVTERLAGEVLSLPIFPTMTQGQVDEVVGRIRAFYGA